MDNPYIHPMVRDLHWLLNSPQLMQLSLAMERKHTDSAWLQSLDQNPRPLNLHMANKKLRILGLYFEALWEFYLTNYPGNKLVAKNLQVFAENTTQGEFDFIYRNDFDGDYKHLEVAVKYYLGVPQVQHAIDSVNGIRLENPVSSERCCWIGPGTADRLDLKYDNMTQRQAKLSQTTAGRNTLKRLRIDLVAPQICLLGCLFYPWAEVDEMSTKTILPPADSNPVHLRGRWLSINQLEQLRPLQSLWRVLDKPHWLAPALANENTLMNFEQLHEMLTLALQQIPHPRLISRFELPRDILAAKTPQSAPHIIDCLEARELIFVVPEGWPGEQNLHRNVEKG